MIDRSRPRITAAQSGSPLAAARLAKGMTMLAMAALVGVDRMTIQAWERRWSRPCDELLPLACKAYGVDESLFAARKPNSKRSRAAARFKTKGSRDLSFFSVPISSGLEWHAIETGAPTTTCSRPGPRRAGQLQEPALRRGDRWCPTCDRNTAP